MKYKTPVRNTVSVIDPQGNSFVLIENDSDDILTILPNICIANAELISEEDGEVNLASLATDQEKTSSVCPTGQWPISALQGELADKIPSNMFFYLVHPKSFNNQSENDLKTKLKYLRENQDPNVFWFRICLFHT